MHVQSAKLQGEGRKQNKASSERTLISQKTRSLAVFRKAGSLLKDEEAGSGMLDGLPNSPGAGNTGSQRRREAGLDGGQDAPAGWGALAYLFPILRDVGGETPGKKEPKSPFLALGKLICNMALGKLMYNILGYKLELWGKTLSPGLRESLRTSPQELQPTMSGRMLTCLLPTHCIHPHLCPNGGGQGC